VRDRLGAGREVAAGMFVAVDHASTRHVRAGPYGLTFIAVCR
jgi:hypothetical protein